MCPAPLTIDAAVQEQLESYLPKRIELFENGAPPPHPPALVYPHVTLTYAQSIDGQISLRPGAQTVLSGPETKAMTHYLRSRHDAIMVGVGTAKADNPGLNTRYSADAVEAVGMDSQPRPFVLDPGGRWKIEDTPKLFSLAKNGEGKAPWWIVGLGGENLDKELVERVQGLGGGLVDAGRYKSRDEGVDWDAVLKNMARTGIRSVMIEGGGMVIKDLLQKRNQKYISSVIITVAPTYLGAGGVDISPRRTTQAQNEANIRALRWIPLGQDVVLAGLIRSD